VKKPEVPRTTRREGPAEKDRPGRAFGPARAGMRARTGGEGLAGEDLIRGVEEYRAGSTFPVEAHRSVTRDRRYWQVLAGMPPEEKIRLADGAAAVILALREGIGKCRKTTP